MSSPKMRSIGCPSRFNASAPRRANCSSSRRHCCEPVASHRIDNRVNVPQTVSNRPDSGALADLPRSCPHSSTQRVTLMPPNALAVFGLLPVRTWWLLNPEGHPPCPCAEFVKPASTQFIVDGSAAKSIGVSKFSLNSSCAVRRSRPLSVALSMEYWGRYERGNPKKPTDYFDSLIG